MKRPSKAIVLCAGYSTRMKPLTETRPKCLLPLWGRPALSHTLETLHRWGVRDILLNMHHAAQPLLRFALDHVSGSPRLNISFEPDILGTGGAVRKAEWFFDDSPVWLVNSDILLGAEPHSFFGPVSEKKCIAALWVTHRQGPRTVDICNGRVTSFQSRTPGAPTTATFCGLHLLDRRILPYIPENGFSSIIAAYDRAREDGHAIAAVDPRDASWCDMGTPEGYLEGHRLLWQQDRKPSPLAGGVPPAMRRRVNALRRSGVTIRGFAAIPPTAEVAPGSTLQDTVLWDGIRITARGNAKGAIITYNLAGPVRAERLVTSASSLQDGDIHHALKRMRWPDSRTSIEHLQPRPSSRAFMRLRYGTRSAIFIRYDPGRTENSRYAGHARLLHRAGLAVPRVLLHVPARSITVMEDLGAQTLLEVAGYRQNREVLYGQALHLLCEFQQKGTRSVTRRKTALEPAFDSDLYAWERSLFKEYFLQRRLGLPAGIVNRIMRELASIEPDLLSQPQVLVHRDFQSSNIIVGRPRSGSPKLGLVDFQGMRIGPALYDLASLLADPYISLSAAEQHRLLKRYAKMAGHFPGDMQRLFRLSAVQRLTQAIGAFARNAEKAETRYFETHIPAGLSMMRKILGSLDKMPNLTEVISQCCGKLPENKSN